MQAFRLQGDCYVPLNLPDSRLWINSLRLGISVWQGVYQGIERQWLRWYNSTGTWILCERERTEAAQQQAEQERQRVQRLIAQLRSLGVEPDLGD